MTQSQGEMQELYPVAGDAYRYRSTADDRAYTFVLDGDVPDISESGINLSIERTGSGEGLCRIDSGETLPFAWAWVGPELHLWLDGSLHVFRRAETRRRGGPGAAESTGDVLAPMPGAVLEVLVSPGERVERNQTVVLMESMKMELVITAPRDGVVRRVAVEPGQQVERGMRLLELAPETDAGS